MIPSTPTFLYRLTSKNGVLSPLRFLLCTKRSCLITDNVRDRQQVSSERHGRHSPYAVPGPNSLPDSIMDCPSNSWLFIRVGAFFSSFSYTNSSSRTSADDSVQTQSWSHKTCVGKNQQPLSSRNFFFLFQESIHVHAVGLKTTALDLEPPDVLFVWLLMGFGPQ